MYIETFLGLHSTSWTALGAITTTAGILIALFTPVLQRYAIKRKIIKLINIELSANKYFLENGINIAAKSDLTNIEKLNSYSLLTNSEWEKWKSKALELLFDDVYIETNKVYAIMSILKNHVDILVNDSKIPIEASKIEEMSLYAKEIIEDLIKVQRMIV